MRYAATRSSIVVSHSLEHLLGYGDFMSELPLVSIGLPVYNEERFLSKTIESLINQDYPNIEIIISDNYSDDATQDICREYSRHCERIRYFRQESNIGLGANFRTVFEESKGDYMLFACGHDLWSERYISECMNALIDNPNAVVAVPSSRWVGPSDELLSAKSGHSDTRGMDEVARYFTIFWGNMHPAFGLIDKRVLKDWHIREIIGEDLIMLTFLALRGDFVHVPQAEWSRREFRFESSYNERIKRYKHGSQKVASTFIDKLLPFARLVIYLNTEIIQSPISFKNKILITLLLMPSIVARFYSGKSQYKTSVGRGCLKEKHSL